jgi:hypothetical protein
VKQGLELAAPLLSDKRMHLVHYRDLKPCKQSLKFWPSKDKHGLEGFRRDQQQTGGRAK